MRYSRVESVLVGAMILLVAVAVAAVAGCSERRTNNYTITGPAAPSDPGTPPAPGDTCTWHPRHCKHKRHN